MKINIKDDLWLIPSDNVSYIDDYSFDFKDIKPIIFKNEIKKVLLEMINKELVKAPSVHRYYSTLKNALMPFLDENGISINYFSDITDEVVEEYIFYLKSRKTHSPSSNSTALAGIKSIINCGILLKLPNYPKFNPFPTKTSKIFGTDDVLKTKYISDEDIEKIEEALNKEENPYLKAVMIIAKETGLRISEILTIRYNCIFNDFEGFPILYTYSFKGEDERYVNASEEVLEVIEQLKSVYLDNPESYLFFRSNNRGKASLLRQSELRSFLKIFCINNNISHKTFHAFRHTIGTTMLNNGATGSQVQNQLGHESLHSTSLYAKIKSETVDREYYRMPILGLVITDETNEPHSEDKVIAAPLPDGRCKNIVKDSRLCEDSYKCFFCNLYRTFKDDLPTHKSHLERIRKERELYMEEEGINSFELLNDIESALVDIIERLETE